MLPYRCRGLLFSNWLDLSALSFDSLVSLEVTGVTATSSLPLQLPAKPPTYCYNNSSQCVSGPKQLVYVFQNEGNNIVLPNYAVQGLSPGYNFKNGFKSGEYTFCLYERAL
jgi:hypothetical protein